MYHHDERPGFVRDAAARYGDPAPDAEEFPAERVLRDLPAAADGLAVARILARFAALRSWLLRAVAAEPVVLEHARDSGLAHLASVRTGWREGELLRRLVVRRVPQDRAAVLLEAAAKEADRDGHHHGARALRQSARAALMWVPPSSS